MDASAVISIEASDRKKLRKNVIQIAWPAVTELILISLFGAIDMIMVGRLGAAAITSVGLVNQPIFLIMAVFQALNIGGAAVVSRGIGSKKYSDANSATRHLIIITGMLSIVIIFPAIFTVAGIYRFMGAEYEVISIGLNYFKIVLVSVIFQNIALSIASVLRASGDTKTPMIINVVSNIINVLMNYLLIFGRMGLPELGVTGAGIGTFLSRVLAFVLLTYLLCSSKGDIKLKLKEIFHWDIKTIKKIVRIGMPSAMEQFVLRSGNLIFVRVVSGLGTAVYAAHQISVSVLSLSFTSGMAFGMAASTLIGQSLGAEKRTLAEEYGKETRHLGSIIATIIGVIFFIFSKQIAGLFSNDIEVIQNTSGVLKVIALIQPFQSSQLILAGALRGAGDTKWPLYSTIAGIWGIRITVAYVLVVGFKLGLMGAWLGICVDQILRYFILFWRFKGGHWKYVKI
ncbi:MATE family efflux transporter [Alkaliphilus peptidifermentans]|uniref:Probable multidrug resistance protein NorM n=1 Tax=Alkaliphilus peptidifermentans DSM 18978 TaxID=1120976 RepID=A0A1G5K2U3_9FIRM|nr:MATE family efflux transporter [Alkaliphilus peptidifermentans]SCY94410.1 putative efflux protein, MATE family [Alkaliphilus peptidifermentans DSM 18978]